MHRACQHRTPFGRRAHPNPARPGRAVVANDAAGKERRYCRPAAPGFGRCPRRGRESEPVPGGAASGHTDPSGDIGRAAESMLVRRACPVRQRACPVRRPAGDQGSEVRPEVGDVGGDVGVGRLVDACGIVEATVHSGFQVVEAAIRVGFQVVEAAIRLGFQVVEAAIRLVETAVRVGFQVVEAVVQVVETTVHHAHHLKIDAGEPDGHADDGERLRVHGVHCVLLGGSPYIVVQWCGRCGRWAGGSLPLASPSPDFIEPRAPHKVREVDGRRQPVDDQRRSPLFPWRRGERCPAHDGAAENDGARGPDRDRRDAVLRFSGREAGRPDPPSPPGRAGGRTVSRRSRTNRRGGRRPSARCAPESAPGRGPDRRGDAPGRRTPASAGCLPTASPDRRPTPAARRRGG